MDTERLEELYQQGATLVRRMIPEQWDKFYLYAEISEESQQVFFYYYPEGQQIPVCSRSRSLMARFSPLLS